VSEKIGRLKSRIEYQERGTDASQSYVAQATHSCAHSAQDRAGSGTPTPYKYEVKWWCSAEIGFLFFITKNKNNRRQCMATCGFKFDGSKVEKVKCDFTGIYRVGVCCGVIKRAG
jgi:hypothetical protein